MMKWFILIFIVAAFNSNTFGQEERKVTINGAEDTYIFNYDNPYRLYDWNVSLSTMLLVVGKADVGVFLNANYKINDNFRASGMIAKSIRTNVSNTSILYKNSSFEIFPKLHYQFFSRAPLRDTKLILSRRYSTLYYIHTRTARGFSLDADAGLNYLFNYDPASFRQDSVLDNFGEFIAFENYYLKSTHTLALTLGTTLTISQHSNYINCDDQMADKLMIHRISILGSIGGPVVKNYLKRESDGQYISYVNDDSFGRRYLPVGFRVVYEVQGAALLLPKYYTVLGIDLGVNSSFKYKTYKDNTVMGELFYLNFRMGVGLGKLTD